MVRETTLLGVTRVAAQCHVLVLRRGLKLIEERRERRIERAPPTTYRIWRTAIGRAWRQLGAGKHPHHRAGAVDHETDVAVKLSRGCGFDRLELFSVQYACEEQVNGTA